MKKVIILNDEAANAAQPSAEPTQAPAPQPPAKTKEQLELEQDLELMESLKASGQVINAQKARQRSRMITRFKVDPLNIHHDKEGRKAISITVTGIADPRYASWNGLSLNFYQSPKPGMRLGATAQIWLVEAKEDYRADIKQPDGSVRAVFIPKGDRRFQVVI